MKKWDPRNTVLMRHALVRMETRGISKAEVLAVLAKPTLSYPCRNKPGTTILGATVNGREVRLLVGTSANGYPCVITVWAPTQ